MFDIANQSFKPMAKINNQTKLTTFGAGTEPNQTL